MKHGMFHQTGRYSEFECNISHNENILAIARTKTFIFVLYIAKWVIAFQEQISGSLCSVLTVGFIENIKSVKTFSGLKIIY